MSDDGAGGNGDLTTNTEFRYIELRGDGSKLPAKKWGGYTQDPVGATGDLAETPQVYTGERVQAHPGTNWGIVDVRTPDHHTGIALLVFDIDVHKAPDDFDPDRIEVPENAFVVKSQSGGFHVYFLLTGYQRGQLTESDFEMTTDPGFDVDIRGSAVSHHVVAPSDLPGVDNDYDVVNDESITPVSDPQAAAEKIQLDGEPLLEYVGDEDEESVAAGDAATFDPDTDTDTDLGTAGDALSAISPDVGHDTWIRLAFAVHSVAPGADGRQLFEDWSKRGSKYDDSAGRQINWIWNNATPGAGVTAGTLFKYALDAGWEPPADFYANVYEDGATVDPTDHLLGHVEPATRRAFWGVSDCRHTDDEDEDVPTLDEVRNRTQDTIEDILDRKTGNYLVDVIMGGGKSYGACEAIARSRQKTFLTTSLRETSDEAKARFDEMGIRAKVLPRADDHCPCFAGEHGDEWRHTVTTLREEYGLTPTEIHDHHDLPCEAGEAECPIHSAWSFDPDDYLVLIGNHRHLYLEHLQLGRAVVMDESPQGAFITEFTDAAGGPDLTQNIVGFIQDHPDCPLDTFEDVLAAHRAAVGEEPRASALEWFEEHDVSEQVTAAANEQYHTRAGELTKMVILSTPAGGEDDEYFHSKFTGIDGGLRRGAFTPGTDSTAAQARIQAPPDWPHQGGPGQPVIALDGTANKRVWEMDTNLNFTVERVLSDDGRRAHLKQRGLTAVQCSTHAKHYSSGEWVTPNKDGAVMAGLKQFAGDAHDLNVITTLKAKQKYERAGLLAEDGGPIDDTEHFMNMRGTNRFTSERLAVIGGSPHYGDVEVKMQAALHDISVTPTGKGMDRDYGDAGFIFDQMVAANIAQAILRFGRDGRGAVVGVLSAHIPDWIPVHGRVANVTTYTDRQRSVIDAVRDLGAYGDWTIRDIYEHDACDYHTTAGVRNFISNLAERGLVNIRSGGVGDAWTIDTSGVADISTNGDASVDVDAAFTDDGAVEIEADGSASSGQITAAVIRAGGDALSEERHISLYMPLFGNPVDHVIGDAPEASTGDVAVFAEREPPPKPAD